MPAEQSFTGEYFFSTMPVCNLIRNLSPAAPTAVREVADGLIYRDFITVGLLLKKLGVPDRAAALRLVERSER